MSKYLKNVGLHYGKLVCVAHAGLDKHPPSVSQYYFKCECGNAKIAYFNNVKAGKTTRCNGCTNELKSTLRTHHGMWGEQIYNSWASLKARCTVPTHPAYSRYGGRGISYDPSWTSFEQFYLDMKDTHFDGGTIDRIDNNKGYCIDNCQWLSKSAHSVKTQKERKL